MDNETAMRLFMENGAPELYLMAKGAKEEGKDDGDLRGIPRPCTAGDPHP